MKYILTVKSPAGPPLSWPFDTKEEALDAVFRGIERGCLNLDRMFYVLGPGCAVRVTNEAVASLPETKLDGVTHHVIVSAFGKSFTIDCQSELEANNTIVTSLRTGVFEQSFRGGEDRIFVWATPGTLYMKMDAAEYEQAKKEAPAPAEPPPSKPLIIL